MIPPMKKNRWKKKRPELRKKKNQAKHIKKIKVRKKGISYQKAYNNGFDEGYDKGFTSGHQQGHREGLKKNQQDKQEFRQENIYQEGFDDGFKQGTHAGGEGLVDELMPENYIIPQYSVKEIIAAGLEKLHSEFKALMNTEQLGTLILQSLQTHSPFSLVRLGDGELLTMAQDTVMSMEEIRKEGHFLPYAGVEIPDLDARDQLINAIKSASVIGVPKLRLPHFQPLSMSIFRVNKIDHQNLQLTDSLVNYYLYKAGYLPRFLENRKVILVGNKAQELGQLLKNHGIHIAGSISPVHGVRDVSRVMKHIASHDFDIALVSAGVSAVLISQKIASELGKVALDFGHLADSIIHGEAPYPFPHEG